MLTLNYLIRKKNENFSLVIDFGQADGIPTSARNENTFIKVKPTINLSTNEFTNLQVQFTKDRDVKFSKKSAQTIEDLLNKLDIQQQTRFLEQFSKLNLSQQKYAYKQFISTPVDVQEFALKQFLTLDPEILIISIDREVRAEEAEAQPNKDLPHQSNRIQNLISNSGFLENQSNEFFNTNKKPFRQSRLIDQSRFQTNFETHSG